MRHRRLPAILAGVAVALLATGLAWRDEIRRLHAAVTLFAPDRIVANFTAMDRAFPAVRLPRGDGPATPLPQGRPLVLSPETRAWAERAAVTGLMVLDEGRVVHAATRLGTAPEDLRVSWSLAKSFVSALTGILLAEGALVSLDDRVTDYAPELAGSAYGEVTLRQLLQMTSGVAFDEDYDDFWSDINRMGRVLALGRSMDAFAAGLEDRTGPPGETWRYVSIDTHALAMALRGATGRSLPELMTEKLFQPLGLAEDGLVLTDGEGVAFALGGLNLTLADYARFGLMVAQEGRIAGRQVVPRRWILESTAASAPTPPGAARYGYHWWLAAEPRPGEVFARGLYGQYLYVDRLRDVVIVVTAADRAYLEPGAYPAALGRLRAISDRLAARDG